MYFDLRKTLTALVRGLLPVLVQGEQSSETVNSIINRRTKLGARSMPLRGFDRRQRQQKIKVKPAIVFAIIQRVCAWRRCGTQTHLNVRNIHKLSRSAFVGLVDPLPPPDGGASDGCNGLAGTQLHRYQYLYFCTGKTSKLSTWHKNLLPERFADSERAQNGLFRLYGQTPHERIARALHAPYDLISRS
jgi:hypothetical protein